MLNFLKFDLNHSNKYLYFFAIPLLLLLYWLGYETPRTNFYQVIGLYGGLFGLYIWIANQATTRQLIWYFVGIGILMRLLLVFFHA